MLATSINLFEFAVFHLSTYFMQACYFRSIAVLLYKGILVAANLSKYLNYLISNIYVTKIHQNVFQNFVKKHFANKVWLSALVFFLLLTFGLSENSIFFMYMYVVSLCSNTDRPSCTKNTAAFNFSVDK